jgi:hypothetical protein
MEFCVCVCFTIIDQIMAIIFEREIINNQSVGTIPIGSLSYDYHQTEEYKNEIFRDHVIFILHYLVTIPVLLFLLSRFIRCLRHRGYISRGSEQCMLEECNRRLVHVATGPNRSLVLPASKNENSSGRDSDDSPPYGRNRESFSQLVELPRPPLPGRRFRSFSANCRLMRNGDDVTKFDHHKQ